MGENILKKIADGIVDCAPFLAKALNATGIGVPVGTAIDALSSIGKYFGLGNSESTPETVATAILSDPDARLKIMQAENEYKLELMKDETEILKLYLEDIQSARNREVETTKATGKRDINMFALAWTVVVGFFLLLGVLLFAEIHKDSSGVIYMLFGSLASGFGVVLSYFFGSSKSSQEKTQLLVKPSANKE